MIKSPKVYIRDSGILHKLLEINNFNQLIGNPVAGSSWEGYVIENLTAQFRDFQPYFYRTANGDEMDLVLEKGDIRIAVECKISSAPALSKGFRNSIDVIKPRKTLIVIPIDTCYEIKKDVWVTGLNGIKSFFE